MQVGYVQFSPVRYDVRANIKAVERLLDGVQADDKFMTSLNHLLRDRRPECYICSETVQYRQGMKIATNFSTLRGQRDFLPLTPWMHYFHSGNAA